MFWSESGEKSAQIKHRLQAKTALNKYVAGFWCEIQQEMHFFTGGSIIMDYGLVILVKNILMLDLFQLLSSPDVNWWTGVVWIIVMFLSADWTLILTAPIHCRASIAETLMQRHISTNLMKKQTHPNLGCPEDEHNFSKCSFLSELLVFLLCIYTALTMSHF